jgi:hypothetical protein
LPHLRERLTLRSCDLTFRLAPIDVQRDRHLDIRIGTAPPPIDWSRIAGSTGSPYSIQLGRREGLMQ